jgi:hypothetical protein
MSFEEAAMRIDVLVVPDCPSGPVVIERLRQALDGQKERCGRESAAGVSAGRGGDD